MGGCAMSASLGGERTALGVPVEIDRGDLDKAAEFLLSMHGSSLWSRMPEHLRERYRDKVRHVLILCGLDPTGGEGRD